jgi:hypothetical protein
MGFANTAGDPFIVVFIRHKSFSCKDFIGFPVGAFGFGRTEVQNGSGIMLDTLCFDGFL